MQEHRVCTKLKSSFSSDITARKSCKNHTAQIPRVPPLPYLLQGTDHYGLYKYPPIISTINNDALHVFPLRHLALPDFAKQTLRTPFPSGEFLHI